MTKIIKNFEKYLVNIGVSLNYIVLYILFLMLNENSSSTDPFNGSQFIRIFMFILIEIISSIGFHFVFKNAYPNNGVNVILTFLTFFMLNFTIFHPIFFLRSSEISYLLVPLISLLIINVFIELMLHLNLKINMIRNRIDDEAQINQLGGYFGFKGLSKDLKWRLISSNFIWGILNLISFIFMTLDIFSSYFGVILVIIVNFGAYNLFGVFQNRSKNQNIVLILLVASLITNSVIFVTEGRWNNLFLNILPNFIIFLIGVIILLLIQYFVTLNLLIYFFSSDVEFHPKIIQNIKAGEKKWNRPSIFVGISILISFLWGYFANYILYNYANRSYDFSTLYWLLVNALFINVILLFGNPKPFKNRSMILVLLRMIITPVITFGIQYLLVLLVWVYGERIFWLIFIIHFIILCPIIIAMRFKYRKFQIIKQKIPKKSDFICPNCKKRIDIKLIEELSLIGFIKCRNCYEKIRKPQIFTIDEKELLVEHQKILNKIGNNRDDSDSTLNSTTI
ncbi:hypothetical protein NEF87_003120 [Candidatus Lokiarchaeum ossiferum]|uniref:Uncharacterized protein n=1 Tax=Candidatus Lokiarchaeum ossiferum TaxID=2951803 RepID=A0ABY6HTS8_9ARCH|nr:hypothetical protein NEF87_003120 [Candidatus Lokiarchaeum sp. B-35]